MWCNNSSIYCKRINPYQSCFILDWPLGLYNIPKYLKMLFQELYNIFLSYSTRIALPQWVSMFPQHHFWRKKFIFLAKLSVPCGSAGLAIYRAPAGKPGNCMVAAGPLLSFSQATDHKNSNFTMVTCFIPTASLAPTVRDSWHSICLARQFEHADQLLFISHSVLVRRKALCIEKMVQERTDEKWWLGMSIKVHLKFFYQPPHNFLQVSAM